MGSPLVVHYWGICNLCTGVIAMATYTRNVKCLAAWFGLFTQSVTGATCKVADCMQKNHTSNISVNVTATYHWPVDQFHTVGHGTGQMRYRPFAGHESVDKRCDEAVFLLAVTRLIDYAETSRCHVLCQLCPANSSTLYTGTVQCY